MDSAERALRAHISRMSVPAILCIDLRGAAVLDPSSAKRVAEQMRSNARRVDAGFSTVERRAVLLPSDNAIVGLQFRRLQSEAPQSNYRAFLSSVELAQWLDEVLTPRERARLTAFLDSKPAPRRAS
jgi:hypothetical protein